MASWDYRPILSGQRTDLVAALIRVVLCGVAIPYRIAVTRRNRQFDRGLREVISCGVPVISVGNLTTGGTGKTPIICYLAKWYQSQGIRVAIVSRGYGRTDGKPNDEALELAARLPQVPHLQNPDRVAAAREAVQRVNAQLILMDDGFQHRRLHRELNLVVVDATCPFGYQHLLPRGLLREPITSLQSADLAIITRCDGRTPDELADIKTTIRQHHTTLPIVRSSHQPIRLREHPDRLSNVSELAGVDV